MWGDREAGQRGSKKIGYFLKFGQSVLFGFVSVGPTIVPGE